MGKKIIEWSAVLSLFALSVFAAVMVGAISVTVVLDTYRDYNTTEVCP